jgi:purine-binding chemotaxis protein CheW
MQGQLVVFQLCDEHYGVEISKVQEIIRMQHITPVPGSPGYVMGVLNLRGRIVPVLDLRRRFGLPGSVDLSTGRIVVVTFGSQIVGMAVDSVTEVLRFSHEMVEKPSDLVASANTEYLKGILRVDSRLVIVVDLDVVLATGQGLELAPAEMVVDAVKVA